MKQAHTIHAGLPDQAVHALLHWFARDQRPLPWRRNRTPYRVWVCEIMLQQTRIDQGLPYFLCFLRRFPSLKSLAEAPLDDVLKAWEGLGYYSRARNLHRAARTIRKDHGGRLPRDKQQLLALPGIGEYTASAILSLAMGRDEPMLDGNVERVLSRVAACDEPVRKPSGRQTIRTWYAHSLPPGKGAAFGEALMELGALICTPRSPRCPQCPLQKACAAALQGNPADYPVKTRRAPLPHKIVGAAVIRRRSGEYLIARRLERGMLGGLWEFPGGSREPGETLPECIARELYEEMRLRIKVGNRCTVVHHAYSHFTIDLHAYHAVITSGRPHCIECSDYAWVKPEAFSRYAFSKADLSIIEALRRNRS